jgi:hypothetical protein
LNRNAIKLRVYERGAGETLACGTGACAAVVSGIRRGLLDSPVKVRTRGGDLQIAWGGMINEVAQSVIMTGPAITVFEGAKVAFAPGKASNAGGVATSGLEMSQNSLRLSWTAEEVDQRLHDIMKNIHAACVKYGAEGKSVNYVKGANIAGFVKVADAMLDQGVV